jgi:hypothetical protein
MKGCLIVIIVIVIIGIIIGLIAIGPRFADVKLSFDLDGETKTIEVARHGLIDPEEKIDYIKYKKSVRNIIWSVILIETVVVPVVFLGWYLYEPVGVDVKKYKEHLAKE